MSKKISLYSKLLKKGYENVQRPFGNLPTLIRGKYRIIFDKVKDKIFLRYKSD